MSEFEIRALNASPETIAMLSEILVETVANGGSVSFMHPLAPGSARAFWASALAAAERGERIVWAPMTARFWSAPSVCCWIARPTSRIAPRSPR